MPAYHSVFLPADPQTPLLGSLPLSPLRTRTRGPAPQLPGLPSAANPAALYEAELALPPDSESYDPLDEALSLFRANTLFRNFELKGPSDKLLIYSILFISECLGKIKANMGMRDAEKALNNVALDLNFAVPGEPSFPLNQVFGATGSGGRGVDDLRGYLSQVRQEIAARLLRRVYEGGKASLPSKYWLAWSKRKFMGKSL